MLDPVQPIPADWFEDLEEAEDRAARHDELLDARDRLAEKASVPFYMAYVERPSDRERRLHRAGENQARAVLYPRRPDSQVGYRHPTRKAA